MRCKAKMLDIAFFMVYNDKVSGGWLNMEINDEIYYNELFAEYSSLLSPAQKEIFDMYFGMDLSFGEIAEIKEISRQSVSDALSKAKKQLVSLEEKLGLCRKKKSIYRLIGGLSGENEYIKKEIENILGDN